jgi:hypothetical protein
VNDPCGGRDLDYQRAVSNIWFASPELQPDPLLPIIGAVIAGLLTRWMYEPEAIVETVVVEERRVTR